MKIAIVGGGISGLVAARRLHGAHRITLFEAESRPGGHSHTVTVDDAGTPRALDTGFLVFNRRDYPRFDALLDELGVASQPTCMSFSVRDDSIGFEYGGATLRALFSQRRNVVRPAFWRLLGDIARFDREGHALARALSEYATIGDLVLAGRFSREFVEGYLLPLGSALWSARRETFRSYPARFVLDFFDRHDLLRTDLARRVRWRTVRGGSRTYVERLVAPFRDSIRVSSTVHAVRRAGGQVWVRAGAAEEPFDQVVFACHGDDALAMLRDATADEREILGAVRYETNDVVLHTDVRLLPRRRSAWASWNYHTRPDRDLATLTYDLNRLQGHASHRRFLVTLNETEAIDPALVIGRYRASHPQYSVDWIRRRREAGRIQGAHRAWFCGAYFGSGFHEDGVRSAEAVAEGLHRLASTGRGTWRDEEPWAEAVGAP